MDQYLYLPDILYTTMSLLHARSDIFLYSHTVNFILLTLVDLYYIIKLIRAHQCPGCRSCYNYIYSWLACKQASLCTLLSLLAQHTSSSCPCILLGNKWTRFPFLSPVYANRNWQHRNGNQLSLLYIYMYNNEYFDPCILLGNIKFFPISEFCDENQNWHHNNGN